MGEAARKAAFDPSSGVRHGHAETAGGKGVNLAYQGSVHDSFQRRRRVDTLRGFALISPALSIPSDHSRIHPASVHLPIASRTYQNLGIGLRATECGEERNL